MASNRPNESSSKSKKRLWFALATLLLLPLGAVVACYLKWLAWDHRLIEVTPQRVFQSAAMPPADLLAACRQHGIRTVIDLRDCRPMDVQQEADALNETTTRHVHLPTSSWPIAHEVDAFLRTLAAAQKPVLVHCHHGEGRSVMMCAVHRIQNEGWSNQRAFDGTQRLPSSLSWLGDWLPSLRRFGREQPKGQFVLSYRPRSD
ncbi:MAG: dual specificity protein phosphatase family protein [Planctomycetota bacterium]